MGGWLGSYEGEDSVDDISRGLFADGHWATWVEIAEDVARRQLRALHKQ